MLGVLVACSSGDKKPTSSEEICTRSYDRLLNECQKSEALATEATTWVANCEKRGNADDVGKSALANRGKCLEEATCKDYVECTREAMIPVHAADLAAATRAGTWDDVSEGCRPYAGNAPPEILAICVEAAAKRAVDAMNAASESGDWNHAAKICDEWSRWGAYDGDYEHACTQIASGRRAAFDATMPNADPYSRRIRHAVHDRAASFKYCIEVAQLETPDLEGTVEARFEIGPGGKVVEASAEGVNDEVSACVAERIRSVKFPEPPDGRTVPMTYRFKFLSE
jgi:hypothetical protein